MYCGEDHGGASVMAWRDEYGVWAADVCARCADLDLPDVPRIMRGGWAKRIG
jgi:hypothetical protein